MIKIQSPAIEIWILSYQFQLKSYASFNQIFKYFCLWNWTSFFDLIFFSYLSLSQISVISFVCSEAADQKT